MLLITQARTVLKMPLCVVSSSRGLNSYGDTEGASQLAACHYLILMKIMPLTMFSSITPPVERFLAI